MFFPFTIVASVSLKLLRNDRLVKGSKFRVINNDAHFGASTIRNAVLISEGFGLTGSGLSTVPK